MPNHDRRFELHDTADFPIVYARERDRQPGTADQWQWEMEMLIARGEAFVIIFREDADKGDIPDADERRLRAIWLKENRRVLAKVCMALISIQENSARRALEIVKSGMFEKAFGIPFKVVASRREAEAVGRRLVG